MTLGYTAKVRAGKIANYRVSSGFAPWKDTLYCPGCGAKFQGEKADERYRQHYRDSHKVWTRSGRQ